ncbi:hypothetical protein K3V87_08975 [Listeria monocytogenes]|uniref:Uncharacterized protein n=3 Tax=Listeria monocytogenes TaxID=1639 RepID=A0A393T1A6_LISMN|nr:hypothetical protein [Listeria monocytogenes]EAD5040158.1 hypothetical protein [Listeria monocytogenes serotype 1/2a]EAE6023802.1 hypothetical protein [Listeria monocytogenes serotype 3a]EAF4519690.1 hypothetical protein [Listeria monocytogenes serotype 4b]EAG6283420.1 hypothetical protein [Listeria monocytogenes CFSAN003810]EAH4129611.1 hypothetical protein [Listeria monocytogenes LIS0077]
MYGNTYQREYARAMGDTAYDTSYQLKIIERELKKKDLTEGERSNLLGAESILKKQVQLKVLNQDAKKLVEKLTQQTREEMNMIQIENEKIGDELKFIQDKLADAFESRTAKAVQSWMRNIREEELEEQKEVLVICKESIRID